MNPEKPPQPAEEKSEGIIPTLKSLFKSKEAKKTEAEVALAKEVNEAFSRGDLDTAEKKIKELKNLVSPEPEKEKSNEKLEGRDPEFLNEVFDEILRISNKENWIWQFLKNKTIIQTGCAVKGYVDRIPEEYFDKFTGAIDFGDDIEEHLGITNLINQLKGKRVKSIRAANGWFLEIIEPEQEKFKERDAEEFLKEIFNFVKTDGGCSWELSRDKKIVRIYNIERSSLSQFFTRSSEKINFLAGWGGNQDDHFVIEQLEGKKVVSVLDKNLEWYIKVI